VPHFAKAGIKEKIFKRGSLAEERDYGGYQTGSLHDKGSPTRYELEADVGKGIYLGEEKRLGCGKKK